MVTLTLPLEKTPGFYNSMCKSPRYTYIFKVLKPRDTLIQTH